MYEVNSKMILLTAIFLAFQHFHILLLYMVITYVQLKWIILKISQRVQRWTQGFSSLIIQLVSVTAIWTIIRQFNEMVVHFLLSICSMQIINFYFRLVSFACRNCFDNSYCRSDYCYDFSCTLYSLEKETRQYLLYVSSLLYRIEKLKLKRIIFKIYERSLKAVTLKLKKTKSGSAKTYFLFT